MTKESNKTNRAQLIVDLTKKKGKVTALRALQQCIHLFLPLEPFNLKENIVSQHFVIIM